MSSAADPKRYESLTDQENDAMQRLDELYSYLFTPGQSFISDGQRGSGKTHHAVAVAWKLVSRPDGPWGRVVLVTNIIFLRRTANGFVKDFPENVFHVTTMKDMLRTVGEVLKEYGRNVRILILLDEAQNFMLSDLNADKVNLSLIRWFGTARKFNCITWLLSPSIKNFVPRIRNFPDDDEPGYMSGIWRKDNLASRTIIEKKGLDCLPRDITTLRYGRDGKVRSLPVPSSPWTRPPEKLKVGEYCYDHLSSADLTLGEDFDIRKFITRISDVESNRIPDEIIAFFDELEAGEEGEDVSVDRILIRNNMEIAERLKALDVGGRAISDEKIAAVLGLSATTYRRYRDAYLKTRDRETAPEDE